jgi:hypothetical protein
VTQVAGVLLDHVQVDQAQRHGLAVVHERVVQGRVGHRRVGQLEFLGQPGVVGRRPGRVAALEIGGPVAAKQVLDRLAREPLPEPGALHLGHVPYKPEQGQARRRDGPLGKLLAGQARALVKQRGAVPVEERLQYRAFGAGQRPFRPLHVWGFPCHGAHLPTPADPDRPGTARASPAAGSCPGSAEPGQPLGVGQHVDRRDLAPGDGEAEPPAKVTPTRSSHGDRSVSFFELAPAPGAEA